MASSIRDAGVLPDPVSVQPCPAQRIETVDAGAGTHLLGDEDLLGFLFLGVRQDRKGEGGWDDDGPIVIRDDQVARLDSGAAADDIARGARGCPRECRRCRPAGPP